MAIRGNQRQLTTLTEEEVPKWPRVHRIGQVRAHSIELAEQGDLHATAAYGLRRTAARSEAGHPRPDEEEGEPIDETVGPAVGELHTLTAHRLA